MAAYIALIRKQPENDYGVDFPDFPGCVTAGKSLEHARRTAAEALAFHIEGLIADGDAVPIPSDLDEVMADTHNRDAVAFLLDVATQAPKAVRIDVMLPEDLLIAIDRVSTNRSRFLADSARSSLAQALR